MKKLFVAGCSLSDYTKVEHTYGELLASRLNYQYIHEGAGCGSNWRIWRTITNHILDGNLTSNDLLIVQYTEFTRTEFWSILEQPPTIYGLHTLDHLTIIDKAKDGNIIRYKLGAQVWQNNKEESDFFERYERYFVSIDFARAQFRTQNYMFQQMLARNNIPTIFTNSFRQGGPIDSDDMLPEFSPYVFREPVLAGEEIAQYNLEPNDFAHMNQLGHSVFADWLVEHIHNTAIGVST